VNAQTNSASDTFIMLTVDQAIESITAQVQPLSAVNCALIESQSLVLAEDVISDIDSPPFAKAMMDGYAIRIEDLAQQTVNSLVVVDEIMAGRVGKTAVGEGQAIRIMTGAPIPAGTTAVIQVELTRFDKATGRVEIEGVPLRAGAAILERAASMRAGECVIPSGQRLRPQELGTLAELGRTHVSVRPAPRIGVLATGDELVAVGQIPADGQIRNSNETMLVAQIRQAGGVPVPLGIAKDERTHLRERIEAGLHCDMLLLSGGVSAGKMDLVPSELQAARVEQIFHKVRIKPGKPVWFGVRRGDIPVWVFGLPGNPVSSMVCFEIFVRTAIRRLMGIEPSEPKPVKAVLKQDHIARGDRPTYHLSRLNRTTDGRLVTTPVAGQGSADLRATVNANSLTLFPAGERQWNAGEVVDVLDWSAD
jgi:molybdopterin molybdotransferase